MKRYGLIMTLVSALIGLTHTLQAQKGSDRYWGPDTTLSPPTDLKDYADVLDHVYGDLDKYLEHDILVDRVPEISRREAFDGTHHDSLLTREDYYLIYTEMTDAQKPSAEGPSMFDLNSDAIDFHVEEEVVRLSMLRYKYHEIKPAVKESDQLYWDKYQVKVSSKMGDESPVDSKEVFALSPLIEVPIIGGEATFILDSADFFTNLDDQPVAIAIDFGDGLGFQEVLFNKRKTIYYGEAGDLRWTYIVHFESDAVLEGEIVLGSYAPDPVLDYDCGEGAIITANEEWRDLPSTMTPISVDAPITNPDNPDPEQVEGLLGIYYGCGNEDCRIRKPYIMVSGFGPNAVPIVSQKRIAADKAKDMLYHHMNGIYGIDGEELGFEAGANNGANILYRLRNEGYDIIILYFANGVDFVQNHAALVQETIRYVNERKAINGSMHENVLCGQSMGGISTRYALADWEREFMQEDSDPYIHHQVRTWISWEGEMQGATVPMGLQLGTWYLLRRLPHSMFAAFFNGAGAATTFATMVYTNYVLRNLIDNVAAQSMLTYHYSDNMTGGDATMHRNDLFLQLMAELDELGYPEHVRRVAIADGSSTVLRPLDLETDLYGEIQNTCLYDLQFFVPKSGDYVRYNGFTGKQGSDQLVFRAKWKKFGIPIPGYNLQVVKNYPRAEYAAPGAPERFYQGIFLGIARLGVLNRRHCIRDNYRAPFVPTTSVFDIQTDSSLDFGYPVSDMLFFDFLNEPNDEQSFGYPHNNSQLVNPRNTTPFDACFANPLNEVHLQNPPIGLANFILSEVAPETYFIQNRIISGTQSVATYNSVVRSTNEILVGEEITQTHPIGIVQIDSNSHVVLESQAVGLLSGTQIVRGARVTINSLTQANLDVDCFIFQLGLNKRGEIPSVRKTTPEEVLQSNNLDARVYPNPTNGSFFIEIDESMKGAFAVIIDSKGQVIQEFHIAASKTSIEVFGNPGIYFLHLVKDEDQLTTKIVVQ